jgi:outer membrane murein-binding lipoprotein Lpp
MSAKKAYEEGDLELISESLAAIAETEMRIETKVDRLSKDVQANCDITNRAHEQLLGVLTKKMEEQTIHVTSLSLLAGEMKESGIIEVITMIKSVRKFARWVMVVIGAGVIGVLFNQGVSAYAKIVDKRLQSQVQQEYYENMQKHQESLQQQLQQLRDERNDEVVPVKRVKK